MAATHRPRRKLCGQCAQSFFQHRALRWGWWLFWGVIWFCWGARALRAANRIRTCQQLGGACLHAASLGAYLKRVQRG